MSWVSVGVAAAGMLAKYKADKDAQNRRESLRGGMEQYQRQKAQESEAAINQLIDKQTPAARGTELAAVTDERAKSLQNTVSAAQATEASPIAGKLSGDYAAAQERSANTVAARTKRAIEQLATMGAPGEQGLKTSMRFGRTAGTVDADNRAISNVGNAYMTDIDNVRANPFLKMAGDVGIGVGTGMMFAPAAGSSLMVPAEDAAAYEAGAHLGGGASTMAGAAPSTAASSSLAFGPAATRAAAMRRAFSMWGK